MLKLIVGLVLSLTVKFAVCQSYSVDFDKLDSLIATTPGITLCEKNGKEDLRFFTKTPEGFSNYKQEFANQMNGALSFNPAHHFTCDIMAEIDCNGKAGNYTFGIEPRTFNQQDFDCMVQLIAFVNSLAKHEFKPAYYLGENVNSKVKFRLVAKDGKPVIQ